MSTLLEVVLTFVAVMFVLALAAQSIQEILKAAFVLRGQALFKAIEGLVTEAVHAQNLTKTDAAALFQELVRRIGALGQRGWRKKALRLDSLPAPKLKELIAGIDPSTIPALQVRLANAKDILALIGDQAERWYDLAVTPVTERYRRRMRILALASSALLVVPLNLGAKRIFDAARTDPEFRKNAIALAQQIDTVSATPNPRLDSLAAAGDSAARVAMAATRKSLAQGQAALGALADTALFRIGLPRHADIVDPAWYVSILLSILFVSLGAPFWHDLFEMIFGLKNRARGKPETPGNGG